MGGQVQQENYFISFICERILKRWRKNNILNYFAREEIVCSLFAFAKIIGSYKPLREQRAENRSRKSFRFVEEAISRR